MRRRLVVMGGVLLAAGAGAGSVRAAQPATRIKFADFYVGATYQDGVGMAPELVLSARARELHGKKVEIVGFMDGILPRDGMYFMLIKEPSFMCPFHTVSFDWSGFVPVFLSRPVEYIDGPVRVSGRLETGQKKDEMGLVSHIRIYEAQLDRLR